MARLNYDIRFLQRNETHENASITLDCFSNFGTSPQARIYLDGGMAPAFTNLVPYAPLSSQRFQLAEIDPGLYVVEFKNNEVGTLVLAKIRIKEYEDLCWDDSNQTLHLLGVRDSLVLAGMLQNDPAGSSLGSISIDEGSTYKSVNDGAPTVSWSNSELASLGVSFQVLEVVFKRDSNSCEDSLAEVLFVEQQVFPELEASGVATNETAAENDDGTITLTVEGGSGSYSFLWADGPVTQNRTDLPSGSYQVTVTDDVTEEEVELSFVITEPQLTPPTIGTLLEFSPLNPFNFVVDPIVPDSCDSLQGLDNVLLVNQKYGSYQKTNYFNKVNICDSRQIQFRSDFMVHILELRDYKTDALIKNLLSVLVQENLGQVEDHDIRIENHTVPGQSRVYFQVGAFPFPIEVGDVFQVINNADGFNGTYSVVSIELDPLLSVLYLLINRNYDIVDPSSSATGRFVDNVVDYNVYESTIDFSDVLPGCYYIKVTATDIENTVTKYGIGEPIRVKETHKNTVLIEYRNFVNAMDIVWTTGFIGKIRVEGFIGHRRVPGGEQFNSRDADFSLVQTGAKPTRPVLFEIGFVPPYMHEKLGFIFKLKYTAVNGVEVSASEGYQEPKYTANVLLAQSAILVEAVPPFKRVNNNGISTINDGGFLLTESGFLKL